MRLGFRDYRDLSYVDYSVDRLLAERFYCIVIVYVDVYDHDKLRDDAALAIALGKLDFIKSKKTG